MSIAVVAVMAAVAATAASAQPAADEARDMALIGRHDLQARSAYQPVVREQNGRWILYVGHHGGTEKAPQPVNSLTGAPEFNGTSVLDVTDPPRAALPRPHSGRGGLRRKRRRADGARL